MHSPVSPPSNPPLFDLNADRLWRPLRSAAPWMVGCMALCLLAALAAYWLIRPTYVADAKIRIDTNAQKVVGTEESAPQTQGSEADRQLQTTLIMAGSLAVREGVMRALQLDQNDAFLRAMRIEPEPTPAARRAQILDLLQQRQTAVILPNTRIASVGFAAPDAALSARVANSFADQLIHYDLEQRSAQSASARRYLEGELARLRDELTQSENRANAYARQAAIIGTAGDPSAATLTSAALVQVNAQAADAAARRITAQADWAAVADMPALAVPQVNGNAAVQSLLSQQAAAQAALDAAMARYGPRHPDVRQLQAQSDALTAELATVSGAIKRGLRAPLDSALRDEQQLQTRLAALRGARLSEQDRGVTLAILMREAETLRNQYDALLARLNQLDAEAGAQVSNLALLDRAEVPDEPAQPSLPMFLAIGVAIGVVLAVLIVLLRELLLRRIRTRSDVVANLGLPVLASVPRAADTLQMRASYGELLAAIQHGGLPASIAITSPTVGDGKSTTAHALARAAGASGKRVLVVDGDMRRPGQHNLFGIANARGLADVLGGEASLRDCVVSTSNANVSLLPAGVALADPAALLASPRLGVIIAEAEEQFDLVVIDTPPLIGLGDPLLLCSAAQRQVMVVRAEATATGKAQAALGRLAQSGTVPMGAILTFYRPSRAEVRSYTAYAHCPA